MDKEKKDLSFILILLSTLIGMAVLFQWAIINRFYEPVLSKILCKWKQDSVVSLFLYLDSVFKYKHKLVHNQSPV